MTDQSLLQHQKRRQVYKIKLSISASWIFVSGNGQQKSTRKVTKKANGPPTKTVWTGYPKGKLAKKVTLNTALIAIKLIVRALWHPKVFFTLSPWLLTYINSIMFVVLWTTEGKKMSALQALSIHVEYSSRVRNCAFLVANATKTFALATRISQLVANGWSGV